MSAMGKFGLLNRGMRVVLSFSRGMAFRGGFLTVLAVMGIICESEIHFFVKVGTSLVSISLPVKQSFGLRIGH